MTSSSSSVVGRVPSPTPSARSHALTLQHVEELSMYKPGGFHPVDLGDVIQDAKGRQYEVIHKLGHGGFSTVWLVYSAQSNSHNYFALKIMRADVEDVNELDVLRHLETLDKAGHPNLVSLHDAFQVSGPNGTHQCLLLPFLGPSLRSCDVVKALTASARHQVCTQVASALAFLHSHGICHGDLTPSNVIFELPGAHSMKKDRLLQLLGPCRTKNVTPRRGHHTQRPSSSSKHCPRHQVESASFSGLDYSLLKTIRVVDLGQAFRIDDPPPGLGVPIDFFPPELCFGYMASSKSDVWHLACVFYRIHCRSLLLPTPFPIFEMLIGKAVTTVGPLPQQWRGKFDFARYGYEDSGQNSSMTEPEWWFDGSKTDSSIASRLSERAPHLDAVQQAALARLLHGMLAYAPKQRLTMDEVVQCLESP